MGPLPLDLTELFKSLGEAVNAEGPGDELVIQRLLSVAAKLDEVLESSHPYEENSVLAACGVMLTMAKDLSESRNGGTIQEAVALLVTPRALC